MNQPGEPRATVVLPAPLRIDIRESANELQIEIFGRQRWYQRLWATVGLILYSLVFVVMVSSVVLPFIVIHNVASASVMVKPSSAAFLVLVMIVPFVVLPTVLLRFGWHNFLAMFVRRESISLNNKELSIARDFFLWRSVRRYQPAHMSDIRQIFKPDRPSLRAVFHELFDEPGSIAFRHKRWRVAFASAATEAEARQISATILRRLPGLAAPVATPSSQTDRRSAHLPWRLDHATETLTVVLAVEHRWQSWLGLFEYLLLSAVYMAVFGIPLAMVLATKGVPLAFIGLLVAGEGMGVYAAFWSLRELRWLSAGQEIVTLTPRDLRIQAVNLWFSQPHVFLAEHIRGLRYMPHVYRSEQRLAWLRQPGAWGALAFDYGAATYRFGNSLNSAEAAELLQLILKQFPQFGQEPALVSA